MNEPCNCCEGTNQLTPRSIVNRPGLDALVYRVGTHAAFLETMKARLSNRVLETPDPTDPARTVPAYPLQSLTTRAPYDASIALLDAWATVGDVLTFYQERIANEGYLRTATERRSILELARLVGYALRPGVAASVFLALELDKDRDVMIQPYEIKAQSAPGPGELPQTFENMDPLDARFGWNKLGARLTQPQTLASIAETDESINVRLYVKGVSANLAANDVVLITENDQPYRNKIFHVAEARPEPEHDRTLVVFQEKQKPPVPADLKAATVAAAARRQLASVPLTNADVVDSEIGQRVIEHLRVLSELTNETAERPIMLYRIKKIIEERDAVDSDDYRLAEWLEGVVKDITALPAPAPNGDAPDTDPFKRLLSRLTTPASIPPRNTYNLDRNLARLFNKSADTGLKLTSTFEPRLRQSLPVALENASGTEESNVRVYAFRALAHPFGHNAPQQAIITPGEPITYKEWELQPFSKLTEPFSIEVKFEILTDRVQIQTTIKIGESSITDDPRPLSDSAFQIDFPAANEVVEIQIQSSIPSQISFDMPIRFQKRGILITMGIDSKGDLSVSSEGSNPTELVVQNVETEPPVLNLAIQDLSAIVVNGTYQIPAGVPTEKEDTIFLDTEYKEILPGSWVVLDRPHSAGSIPQLIISHAKTAKNVSRAEYGITGKSTILELDQRWLNLNLDKFDVIRGTTVFAQSEQLTLAEEPIEASICGETDSIELDEVYSGLQSGRWLIVSGERDDIKDAKGNTVRGVQSAELVMLAEVLQQTRGEGDEEGNQLPGDHTHTFITLATPLAYCYRRESVSIYGNVVKATHGETRRETLGSGDASKVYQDFTLKQSPLTLVSAPTPAGLESTLKVYVNDMQWREANSLADLTKTDRKFITKTDDENKTTVIFGNGQRGARLPTGFENIRAVYRNGMGKLGNVRAGQISLLQSKPLGVKGVKNPVRASGGAEKESRDTARKNAPLTVTALDRLVSVQDYADFSRTFAGIGKSVAARIPDGRRELVHVTIAGADDIPIDETSDLFHNLLKALRDFGDPYQPIALQVRELKFIVLSANVRILPDYEWEPVVKAMRSKLLDTFSFERCDLGQDVLLSEVIATIQAVRGVAYVDVDVFGSIPEKKSDQDSQGHPIRRLLTPQEIADEAQIFLTASNLNERPEKRVSVNLAGFEGGAMHPAQLAYLTPDVADTLVLNQIK